MNAECEKCKAIVGIERALDDLAEKVNLKVKELCRPSTEENNRRWARFASICRIPVIGAAYLRLKKAPLLVDGPKYWDEPWYRDTGGSIRTQALALEKLKAGDLAHWGDEIVQPFVHDDPAGYATPDYATRRKSYQSGWFVHVPDKFDYSSAAGLDKHETDLLVMCSETLALMPVANCRMTIGERTGWKPVYKALKTA